MHAVWRHLSCSAFFGFLLPTRGHGEHLINAIKSSLLNFENILEKSRHDICVFSLDSMIASQTQCDCNCVGENLPEDAASSHDRSGSRRQLCMNERNHNRHLPEARVSDFHTSQKTIATRQLKVTEMAMRACIPQPNLRKDCGVTLYN